MAAFFAGFQSDNKPHDFIMYLGNDNIIYPVLWFMCENKIDKVKQSTPDQATMAKCAAWRYQPLNARHSVVF